MRKLLYIALLALVIPSSDKITDLYLPNGLKLILKEDDTVSSIGLSVFYNVGSHDDPDGQKGMAGLQRFIMQESGSYNGMDHKERNATLDRLTEESGYVHRRDFMYFSYEFSPRWLNDVIAIESSRLSEIDITDVSLGRAKRAMIAEGMDVYKEPQSMHNTYPDGHPYQFSPWGDTLHIKSISVDDAIDFRKQYINPNSATIVVTGNFSSREVVQSIYAKFGDIKNNGRVQLDPDFSLSDTEVPHEKFLDAGGLNREMPAGIFVHTNIASITIPSFREDDMMTVKHIANLIRYDSALEQQYAKKYLNKNGHITLAATRDLLGPSQFSFITVSFVKKGKVKKIKRNITRMFKDISVHGFSKDQIDIYRKRELLRLYTKNSPRSESVSIGKSELIYGDYSKHNREIERLESLDNEEIKRVAGKYLAGQHINTYEAITGRKNFLTPLISVAIRFALMNSGMRLNMKRPNLENADDL